MALTLFEGLAEVAPDDAYHWLALGLAQDLDGDVEGARQSYEQAVRVEPHDPRPELNLAELALADGDFSRAERHRRRAEAKADRGDDRVLLRKAAALGALMARGDGQRGRVR